MYAPPNSLSTASVRIVTEEEFDGPSARGDPGALFRTVLAPPTDLGDVEEPSGPPAFFRDLNLDQIVAAIVAGKQEYNLAPFFIDL